MPTAVNVLLECLSAPAHLKQAIPETVLAALTRKENRQSSAVSWLAAGT